MGEHHKEDTCQEHWTSLYRYWASGGWLPGPRHGYAVCEHQRGACNARTYAQQCSYFETRGRYVLDEALKHQEEGMPITNSKPACYWLEGLSGPCKHQKGVLLGSRTKMPPISVCRRVAATRKPLNDDIEVIEPACLWSIIIVNQYTRISKMSDQKEKSVTENKNQSKK